MEDHINAQKSKEERDARRADVKSIMETLGINSVPVKVLAEKYNCSERTIYDDIKFWIRKVEFKNVKFEGRKLLMMVRKNFEILEDVCRSDNESNKIRAVNALNQSMEMLTKISENFGLKKKVADKHEIDIPKEFSKEEIEEIIKRALGQ